MLWKENIESDGNQIKRATTSKGTHKNPTYTDRNLATGL